MNLKIFPIGALFFLAGCVQVPQGPSVAVMPGAGKPFDLFVNEEQVCRHFAEQQVGIAPNQAAANSIGTSAAIGTGIGAVAGTAIGATVGRPLEGMAIGAGAGLVEGSAIGVGAGASANWTLQQRYNVAYEQCMYAKGNQIPGTTQTYSYPPPAPYAHVR